MNEEQKLLTSGLNEVLACCNDDEERRCILQRLEPLRSELAAVSDDVENKAVAHRLLAEHLAACEAAREKVANIEDSLSSKDLSPEQIAELKSSLEDAKEQLKQLESQQAEVKSKMREAGLTCKESVNGEPVDIAREAQSLLAKINKDDVKLQFCERVIALERQMQKADGDIDQLKQVYTDDLETMGSVVQVMVFVVV